MIATPTNDFLERLDHSLDWRPLEKALQEIYGLSDPQCEEQVRDRLSWRRFVGLGLQDAVPDETTLVRFRKWTREGRKANHGIKFSAICYFDAKINSLD